MDGEVSPVIFLHGSSWTHLIERLVSVCECNVCVGVDLDVFRVLSCWSREGVRVVRRCWGVVVMIGKGCSKTARCNARRRGPVRQEAIGIEASNGLCGDAVLCRVKGGDGL